MAGGEPGRAAPRRPELVLLDVGGVLLLPGAAAVADGLRAAGIEPSTPGDPLVAHYRTVAGFDATDEVDRDPAIFDHALRPLGVALDSTWYVGDTVTFDVAGAGAAGIRPLHLDPHGWCPRPDGHDHVADLDGVADLLDRG